MSLLTWLFGTAPDPKTGDAVDTIELAKLGILGLGFYGVSLWLKKHIGKEED